MVRTRRLLALAAGTLMALAAAGCQSADRLADSEAFLNRYFDALLHDDRETLEQLYSPIFFDATTAEVWFGHLDDVAEQLGPIESFEMEKWSMELLPNGAFTTFVCRVRHSRHESSDTITVVDPVDGSGLAVFGHHIRSEALTKGAR